MNEQADAAVPAMCVSIDIRLVNQQRCLTKDQQRCEYPVAQMPPHDAIGAPA